MKEISYIIVTNVPGDELPVRIEAFSPGRSDSAMWFGAGQTLDHALSRIQNFTGCSLAYMKERIYEVRE